MDDDEYLLPDGRRVPHQSHLARIDREVRESHIQAMSRLDTEGRRAYLQRVERSEGAASMEKLKAAYLVAWEKRRAGR
jgi:hypothetical protein